MRESKIESFFVGLIEDLGGTAEKFKSPARRNVPDRLVILPCGIVSFAEIKRTGKGATDAQARDHERRRRMGFRVDVINSLESAKAVAESLRCVLHLSLLQTRGRAPLSQNPGDYVWDAYK